MLAVSEQDDIINTCKKVGQGSIPAPYKLKKKPLALKILACVSALCKRIEYENITLAVLL